MCLAHQENHFSPHFCIPWVLNEVVLLLMKVNAQIISSERFLCFGHGFYRCTPVLSCQEKATKATCLKGQQVQEIFHKAEYPDQARCCSHCQRHARHYFLNIESLFSDIPRDPARTTKQV